MEWIAPDMRLVRNVPVPPPSFPLAVQGFLHKGVARCWCAAWSPGVRAHGADWHAGSRTRRCWAAGSSGPAALRHRAPAGPALARRAAAPTPALGGLTQAAAAIGVV